MVCAGEHGRCKAAARDSIVRRQSPLYWPGKQVDHRNNYSNVPHRLSIRPSVRCAKRRPAVLPERADVLVIGAGPAGLAAAIELKRNGIQQVVIAERESEAGGMPRLCHHTGFGRADLRRILSGPDYARIYRGRNVPSGVEIYTNTTITGWQSRSQVNYTSPANLCSVQLKRLLLSTRTRE